MQVSDIPGLIPWYSASTTWHNVDSFRNCYEGYCTPCLMEREIPSGPLGAVAVGLFGLSLFSCAQMLYLLYQYWSLHPAISGRSYTTVNMTISFLTLSLAGLLGLGESQQENTLCYDSITSATGLTNVRCALSGMFVIYGLCAFRTSAFMKLRDVLDLISDRSDTLSSRTWFRVTFGNVLPVVLALAALPTLQRLGLSVCGPRFGLPFLLVLGLPVLPLDIATIVTHIRITMRVNALASEAKIRQGKVAIASAPVLVGQFDLSTPAISSIHFWLRPIYFWIVCIANVFTVVLACGFAVYAEFGHRKPGQHQQRMSSFVDCVFEKDIVLASVVSTCFSKHIEPDLWEYGAALMYFHAVSPTIWMIYAVRKEMFPWFWRLVYIISGTGKSCSETGVIDTKLEELFTVTTNTAPIRLLSTSRMFHRSEKSETSKVSKGTFDSFRSIMSLKSSTVSPKTAVLPTTELETESNTKSSRKQKVRSSLETWRILWHAAFARSREESVCGSDQTVHFKSDPWSAESLHKSMASPNTPKHHKFLSSTTEVVCVESHDVMSWYQTAVKSPTLSTKRRLHYAEEEEDEGEEEGEEDIVPCPQTRTKELSGPQGCPGTRWSFDSDVIPFHETCR